MATESSVEISKEEVINKLDTMQESYENSKGFSDLVALLREGGMPQYSDIQTALSRDPKKGFKMQVVDAAARSAGIIQ